MAEKREWDLSSLKDAGVVLIDCDHRTPPAAEAGYPYIAIPQLKNGRIDLSEVRKISPTHFEEWTRKANPQHYDVILSRRCNPGETAHVPPNLKCALGQNLVLLRADGKKVLPQYLRWITQGPLWWEQISKFINVGAVFDSLRCADVPNFELPLPPISEQCAIAAVLEALDNKIELNQRMNVTLEGIAQTLFKSWFVDFDPVKAKAEGREPEGLDDATAALFPSTFTESSLGLIPEGWEALPFSEMIQLIGGGTPKTSVSEYWGGNIPWFSVADAPAEGDVFVISTEKNITQSGLDNSSARLLPMGTTIITARGTVGRIALVGVPMAMNQSCYGIRGISSMEDFFIYYATKSLLFKLKARTHGSVFDTITRDTFTDVSFVRPPSNTTDRFESQVAPLFKRIQSNLYNINTLKAIRDHLLPRLISGKLRVDEVNKTVEALAL